MNSTRMKPLDAAWLLMESPEAPMHVGVLAIFSKPVDAPDDYLIRMADQMRLAREPVAPWNYRLARPRNASLRPQLVTVRDFDLDYHFRHSALPTGGGERELGVMVSRLHSHALDRNKPLWEFHLIEGLDGDRFAIYVKVHHALLDNINAIPMLMATLSASAEQQDPVPLWSQALYSSDDPEPTEQLGGVLLERLRDPARSLAGLGKTAASLLRNTRRTRGSSSTRAAPRSTLNRRINTQRRVATQQFDQARIARLAEQTDSTLDEILIYLCGSSLRRFFKEYNALPDSSLVGLMPVAPGERGTGISRNAISASRVKLGTDIGDPPVRLDAVKKAIRAAREDRAALEADGMISYEMLRAAPVYASQLPLIEHLVPPLFNLRMTHTTTSGQDRFYSGARLEAIYPVSHLMQFSALNIGIVSYAGKLNLGFTGARDTLPHLQRMAVYFGKALSDLEALVAKEEVTT